MNPGQVIPGRSFIWEVMIVEAKCDYYGVLGVDRKADENAIKKAYRKLAKKYHPDTNAGNTQAEQKFKEITEAYTILSDPEKRKLYDRFGHAAFDGNNPKGGTYRTVPEMENIGNIILKVEIWMVCLKIFSEIFFVGRKVEHSKQEDLKAEDFTGADFRKEVWI